MPSHTLWKSARIALLAASSLYLTACIKIPCTSFPTFTIDAECVLGEDPGDFVDGVIDDVTGGITGGGNGNGNGKDKD